MLCYDQGRRFYSANFVLFVRKRAELPAPWRVGMAVTKKTGCAVWRNRVRRLIRECFRLGQTSVTGGFDFVVVPKRSLNPRTLDLETVQGELLPLLRTVALKNQRNGAV